MIDDRIIEKIQSKNRIPDIPGIDLFGSEGIIPGAQTAAAIGNLGKKAWGTGPVQNLADVAKSAYRSDPVQAGLQVGQSYGMLGAAAVKNWWQSPDTAAYLGFLSQTSRYGVDPVAMGPMTSIAAPAHLQATEQPIPEEIKSPAEKDFSVRLEQVHDALPESATGLERWEATLGALSESYDIGGVEKFLVSLPFEIAIGTLATGGLSLVGKGLVTAAPRIAFHTGRTRAAAPPIRMMGEPGVSSIGSVPGRVRTGVTRVQPDLNIAGRTAELAGRGLQLPWKFEEAMGSLAFKGIKYAAYVGVALPLKMMKRAGEEAAFRVFGTNIAELNAADVAKMVEKATPEQIATLDDIISRQGTGEITPRQARQELKDTARQRQRRVREQQIRPTEPDVPTAAAPDAPEGVVPRSLDITPTESASSLAAKARSGGTVYRRTRGNQLRRVPPEKYETIEVRGRIRPKSFTVGTEIAVDQQSFSVPDLTRPSIQRHGGARRFFQCLHYKTK